MKINLSFIKALFNFGGKGFVKVAEDANPADFGFKKTLYGAFQKNGFMLYKNPISNKWIFDRSKKSQPGVIARFDGPLLDADVQYALAFIERNKRIKTNKQK